MNPKKFIFRSDTKEFSDDLERRKVAEKYVNFINDLDGHHVVALDAPWGSGKSTLITYMCEYFDTNKNVYIKYNAWENDYTEEPLISLMSDLFEKFKAEKLIGTDEYKGFITSIVKASKLTAKGTLKGFSKIVIGDGATKDLGDALLTMVGTVTDEIGNNLFKEVSESKKSRKEFKVELKKYTNNILTEKDKDKLIIIIDELDRCRPTFAIELLENIKHLFDIENIIFFIAVDSNQLSESIKAIYGNGFDSNTYLHRFFDFELHLTRDEISNYFMKRIIEKLGVKLKDFDDFVKDFTISCNLTIRDINKVINEVYILRKIYLTMNSDIFDTKLYISLLIIKHKNQDLYKYIRGLEGKITSNTFIEKYKDHTNIRKLSKYLVSEDDIKIKLAIRRIEETI